jgi:predicted  nucleic acid-binding Zn-ribbon protein
MPLSHTRTKKVKTSEAKGMKAIREQLQNLRKEIRALKVEVSDLQKELKANQETRYLLSIPEMRESIIEGMRTPLEECSEELEW